MSSLEGKTIGGFAIQRELGHGGMGVVFLAKQKTSAERSGETDQTGALKLLAPALAPAAEPTVRERFLREARAGEALKHEGIVAVLASGEDRGNVYLALEYLDGGSLHDRVKTRGPLPWREAARVGAALARALSA